MRFYGSRDEQKAEITRRIDSYRATAALTPTVIEILRKFDGKVFNCRLDKALREATNNDITVHQQYGFISISGHYLHSYNSINLATFRLEDLKNKRIDAEKLIEQVKASREELLKKAYTIETTAPDADQIREYIKQTIDKLETYCRTFPDDIREIYNIPYCIRTN